MHDDVAAEAPPRIGRTIAAGCYFGARRLSPNSRKIEVVGNPEQLLGRQMLRTMGHELASVHLGTTNRRAALDKDFSRRDPDWLLSAAKTAARFATSEYKDWRRG